MDLLKTLLKIHSPSGEEDEMQNFILEFCTHWGLKHKKDIHGNIFVTSGVVDSYPCIGQTVRVFF